MNRIAAMENNIFTKGHFGKAGDFECNHPELHYAMVKVWMEDSKNLQNLSFYEQRISRNLQRNMALLDRLQSERKAAAEKAAAEEKAARAKAFEEAKLLAQLSLMKGQPYDPKRDFPPENGFDFSAAEINAAIDRDNRLREARMLMESAPKPEIPLRKAA